LEGVVADRASSQGWRRWARPIVLGAKTSAAFSLKGDRCGQYCIK